jgi:N-acetylmuramoyl-L-alanine amidase
MSLNTARKRGSAQRFPAQLLAFAFLFVTAALVLLAAPSERQLSVYSTAANYSVRIVQRQGHDYIGLLEVLEPLGSVSAKSDGHRWRLHYNNILGEFVEGRSHARVQGRDADLLGPFLMDNGRGLVPLASLTSLLPRFLGGPATLHAESARLFIGSVATHFTASVSPDDSSRLVFHFTAPVNPSVASEHGKLRMTFSHEPVTAPASPRLTFDSKTIPEADYAESNGAAEIAVTTTVPLMASFSPDGRTITLEPSKNQAETTVANPPANSLPQNKPAATAPVPTAPTVSRRFLAIVDASHGGDDRGEALSSTLAEKDVTIAFARRLRQELQDRGIATLVLRDNDANLSLDERAYLANNMNAAVYIAIHAASSGHGVRLYTALLPYADEEDRGPFLSWARAQQASLSLSQVAAGSVATELKKQEVAVRTLLAPLRPLNNVVMAALAVEVAPPASDVAQLTSPQYQQLIASAVAAGIANVRDQLGGSLRTAASTGE